MDAHTPHNHEDLSDFERRLAGWHPDSEGLDADAMLFAAGHAAGRRGRSQVIWPALCVVLAVQAAGLGLWGLSERAECRALASLLRQRTPAPGPVPATAVAVLPESASPPSPDGYLHLRRQMEQDPNRWLASLPSGARSPSSRRRNPTSSESAKVIVCSCNDSSLTNTLSLYEEVCP